MKFPSDGPMTRILITGGTGSLGCALIPRFLEMPDVERIIVYSRDEQKQHELAHRIPDPRLVCFLGDVRDRDRLGMAFRGVDTVIHAAALKIVPAGEADPMEFIKTNVSGSANVVTSALDAHVSKVLLISTDKAVSPVNLYGSTKLAAEKLFIAANTYSYQDGPVFSVVRYGNVAGSRGSVIPLWRACKARGEPLPLTHREMTRFWITLPEAAGAVLQAIRYMEGGEVFIPKMRSYCLYDLARAIDDSKEPVITGIRPGEKLHEDMITHHEGQIHEAEDAFVILPPGIKPGNPVSGDFHYSSNSPHSFLTVNQLRERLRHV